MRLLITGSVGFIGSNLMKALKGKHHILGVDKKFGVDIADYRRLLSVVDRLLPNPDLIVHLAAQT